MNKIKKLTLPEQIEEVTHILYRVYIEKMNWQISPENPSHLRVEERNGRKVLLDDFVDTATWFGIFQGEKIIGCARVQPIDERGHLEVERYANSETIKRFLPQDRSNCVELSKLALLPGTASPKIIDNLLLELFRHCQKMEYHVNCFTNNRFLKRRFDRICFPLLMEEAFKYHDDDPEPVNYYSVSSSNLELINVIDNMEAYIRQNMSADTDHIFRALEIVAPILPIPVYWHGRDGAVMGINEKGLVGMGTRGEDIIGKSPYEFYPKETAEHILSHHELVMSSEKILEQEEKINDITTGKIKYFCSIKAPIYGDDGDVIGIVGTSIETTDTKESTRLKQENERLAIENRFQNKLIMEQKNFKEIINQAVHDIRSPLASLLIVSKYTRGLSDEVVSIITGASKRINDIANNLLIKYRLDEKNNNTRALTRKTNFQVSLALQEIISEKKYEFYDYNVDFDISIGLAGYMAFLNAEETSFKRMISNVVNNAVEALENKTGLVGINLETTEHLITITISDDGVGMSPHVVEKIKNGISVTDGKSEGYGIGYTQIRDSLMQNNGHFDVQSEVGRGTRVVLTFTKPEQPNWIAERIEISKNDIVMVLDDDTSIHKAWEMRLRSEVPNLNPHCFKTGSDAIECIEALSDDERERVLFLVDYELPNQNLTGLDVIEKTNLRRALLVTNRFSNKEIQHRLKELDIQMLPKPYISEIPISVQ